MLAVEGGAIANLYAVLVARHSARPEVKNDGVASLPPLVVFQSDRVRCLFTDKYVLFCPCEKLIYELCYVFVQCAKLTVV